MEPIEINRNWLNLFVTKIDLHMQVTILWHMLNIATFPPPKSEVGVVSTLRPNKEDTPGFQGTVSLAGNLLDGGYSQEGGSLTEGPVDADTCKHTS